RGAYRGGVSAASRCASRGDEAADARGRHVDGTGRWLFVADDAARWSGRRRAASAGARAWRGLHSGGGVLGRRQRRAHAQAVVFFGAGGEDRRGSATAGRRDTRGTQASRGASRRASRRTAGMKRLKSRNRRPTVEPRGAPPVRWA